MLGPETSISEMTVSGAKIVFFIESKKQKRHYFTAVTHFFFELPQYYKQ